MKKEKISERNRSVKRVGIIDLLEDSPFKGPVAMIYATFFRKQFVSITPQAVSVWCRQLGHEVQYATYYGQQDPRSLLPDNLDVVFIATHTPVSALAYALAKVFRREKTLTVIGGPHAKSFPRDCLRFFDLVVQECDKTLIDDILQGRFDPPSIITSGRPFLEFPSVEERRREIETAAFFRGRPVFTSIIPLLASIGCPYHCDFCTDWNNPYFALPQDQLGTDLRFISENWPQAKILYHDPNFAVRFDEVMDTIETVPEGRRNGYLMESSLSILKPFRLKRLRDTNCQYVAPGVESWTEYSNKAGVGSKQGREKLEQVVDHFNLLGQYVSGMQANFLFGTDLDKGSEPIELTKEFIRRLPLVWPSINIPAPFGGTPLTDSYMAEGRVLKEMPFAFYYVPYLSILVKNYHPVEYYDHLIDLHRVLAGNSMLARRLTTKSGLGLRFIHTLRTLGIRKDLTKLREVRGMLATDKQFLAFHECRSETVPEYYFHKIKKRLGPYAELLSRADFRPVLDGERAPAAAGAGSAKDARLGSPAVAEGHPATGNASLNAFTK